MFAGAEARAVGAGPPLPLALSLLSGQSPQTMGMGLWYGLKFRCWSAF